MLDGDDVAINIHIVEDIAFIYLHKIDKLHSVHSSAFVLWQKSFFFGFSFHLSIQIREKTTNRTIKMRDILRLQLGTSNFEARFDGRFEFRDLNGLIKRQTFDVFTLSS